MKYVWQVIGSGEKQFNFNVDIRKYVFLINLQIFSQHECFSLGFSMHKRGLGESDGIVYVFEAMILLSQKRKKQTCQMQKVQPSNLLFNLLFFLLFTTPLTHNIITLLFSTFVINIMAEIPAKMKALLKSKAMTSYEYTDIDVPEPKEGEILVKMEYVAICGSDIPLYKVCLRNIICFHANAQAVIIVLITSACYRCITTFNVFHKVCFIPFYFLMYFF